MNNWSKKTVFMPKSAKKFKCIGSCCEDTCCSGWSVPIDENTYNDYRNTNDEKLKKLLSNKIIKNSENSTFFSYGSMILKEELRCSFLNEEGLCDIHKYCGEENLCITCTNYPRVINIVDEVYEKTLLFSCPEATRILLLNKEKMEFIEIEEEIDEEKVDIRRFVDTETFDEMNDVIQFFWEIRIFTISILQNRNYNIVERLSILKCFYEKLQNYIDKDDIEDIPDIIEKYKKKYEQKQKENIQVMNFEQHFQELENKEDILARLKNLSQGVFSKISNNNRLVECILEFKEGLGLNENLIDQEIIKKYEEAFEKYYDPFMKNREYIFENYLVSCFFKDLTPFKGNKDLFNEFSIMVNRYLIIRDYLIGMAAYNNKSFNEEHVVKLIQALSKTIEHNGMYKNMIQ